MPNAKPFIRLTGGMAVCQPPHMTRAAVAITIAFALAFLAVMAISSVSIADSVGQLAEYGSQQ